MSDETALEAVAELAAQWAHQASDYDEDTEQQITDGNALLILLREHGVAAADTRPEPKPVDPAWIDHLSHRLSLSGCQYCARERAY